MVMRVGSTSAAVVGINMTGKIRDEADPSSIDGKTYTLKFVLAGSPGVGKTRLARRIVGRDVEESMPTVGMEFATRSLKYDEHSIVRAQIWDAAGHLRFKSATEAFFRGAVGVMLVYDITNRSTFNELDEWLARIRELSHQRIALCLVGNKADKSSKHREVSMMEGMRFARKNCLDFFETSAMDGMHVEEAARQMIMTVARYLPRGQSVWKKEVIYPLPQGWIRVCMYREENSGDKCGRSGTMLHNKIGREVWYENIWTGRRVSARPLHPAGPSEACIVSQVARSHTIEAIEVGPNSPVKEESHKAKSVMAMVKKTSSSIQSMKARGWAAASECMSKCMDS